MGKRDKRVGDGDVVLRTLIWQGHVFVDLDTFGNLPVEDWSIRLAGGRALPDWIGLPYGNVVVITKPADIERVDLEVTLTPRDRAPVAMVVRIDLDTGAISLERSPQDATLRDGDAVQTTSVSSGTPFNDALQQVAFDNQ